jgi:hypothetical protein
MRSWLLALVVVQSLCAQETPHLLPDTVAAPVWTTRRLVATGIVGSLLGGSLIGSYNDWWKDSAEPFHFVDDGLFNNYSLGVDKIGHAYTSYFYFHSFRNIMLWGGYDTSMAFWVAGGTAALFAVSIEIGDGLSPYGFSFYDLAFNMGGLGYAMAQVAVPYLRNFSFKWSYVPSGGYRWPPHFTDHYDAHTYWLAFNVHNLLPEKWNGFWPECIQLAVGYGVNKGYTRRELAVGIDLNIGAIDVENPELRLLRDTMNLFHVPSPAVKMTEGESPRWYVIHTQ